MANKFILLSFAALLFGCDRAAENAEAQYDIVSKTGSKAERCAAGRRVQAEWLSRNNEKKYREWKLTADIYCLASRYPD